MKKINKKIIKILIAVICLVYLSTGHVFADVGSFEDYSSGGDWGSSWDSDWGSSDWGSSWDDDYYGSSSSFFFFGGPGDFWFMLIIFVIIVATNIYRSKHRPQRPRNRVDPYARNYQTTNMGALESTQTQIENKIQLNDPNFNKEEFISWSKNLFIKLQQAWTARDWETIRTFETESLFEQHKNQLQGYIKNNQINVMDRICVNYAHLYKYTQQGDKEVLTVRLNSRMADYIIDATTNEVLKGNKEDERVNTYLLTFIRKNGIKTKEGTIEINTTNCPNCGAPTKITSSGKCEYCGSVVTTGEYNWVLSNLERERM